jgi:hypothetical protein
MEIRSFPHRGISISGGNDILKFVKNLQINKNIKKKKKNFFISNGLELEIGYFLKKKNK